MFSLNNKKSYKVSKIFGGESDKGLYTFIYIDDELKNGQKFPDKLKVNIWGDDLSKTIKEGTSITITKANEVGLVNSKDKTGKWYQNLTISCDPKDIVVGNPIPQKQEPTYSNNIDDLPF